MEIEQVDHISRFRRGQSRFEVGIPHRRLDIRVPEDFSHFVDTRTVLDQS